ncbi:hypothetical protein NEA10_17715 [Phormidium yuhuli AB48]|uniref:Uncharacterized protein n=1 Tax=Phormidium yuhuli AB48 TaxID=2940671 RepID=A0ABY5AN60_9CYAN|nr:hypothetical protein [Phormidium yuhuli]USR90643.1 hypothetical protein NEA10_17715 [Phormidium yuhuli AB48]
MTDSYDDDRPLIAFLQHHQPLPPPAPAELEAQLLQQIGLEQTLRRVQRRRRWRLCGAIAAALIPLAWLAHRSFSPQLSPAELAQLETFLEESWYCSSYECEPDFGEQEEWEMVWELSER